MALHDSISPCSMDVCVHGPACTCSKSEQETGLKEVLVSAFATTPYFQSPRWSGRDPKTWILFEFEMIFRWEERKKGRESPFCPPVEWLHVGGIEQN